MSGQTDAVIGYVHPGWVRAEFAASLLAVCLEGQTRVRTVVALESGPNISTARNLMVRDFLAGELAPWLLMIDTDMVFASDTADRLIAAADPVERPVMGALCWTLDQGKRQPTVYELVKGPKGEGLAFTRPQPTGDVMRVTGTGAACLLVHRDVFETIEKTSMDISAPWFRESSSGSRDALMGEDLTFCLRCAAAQIPVHVHTGVEVGHMKAQLV